MKQFLIKVSIIAIVSFVMIILIDIAILRKVDNLSYYSHERNFSLAYYRLKALKDSNKIVIIGGSSGAFGFNSRMIHEAFNLPVVNTCTHASIGLRMQFETFKDMLRDGDIVILCPEYGGGKERLYGGYNLLRILSTHLPEGYRKISLRQWLYIYKFIGLHNLGTSRHEDVEEYDDAYSANAINEFGDIEWKREHKDSIDNYTLSGVMDEELIDYFKYIRDYTKSKGIKLVFLPPTFMKSNFKNCADQIDSLAYCLETNGVPWQSSPSYYSFEDSLYFDTPYHMTQEGADIRTKAIIEDLHRLLNDKE